MKPFLFINYRADDSQYAALALCNALEHIFGKDSVFFDTKNLKAGSEFATDIENALNSCEAMLVVIGKTWLFHRQPDGTRSIDHPSDWVRREIEVAINRSILIVPIYIQGMHPIAETHFPPSIQKLGRIQSFHHFNLSSWKGDLESIRDLLIRKNFKRQGELVKFPQNTNPTKRYPPPLTRQKILDLMPKGWTVESTEYPGEYPAYVRELYKRFTFKGFDEAISFMNEAAPIFTKANHHPRWQNLYSEVRIWLTTWDLEGKKITQLDIDVANKLNTLYKRFKAKTFK
ncbi:MAG TPA: 4a-hydroxytetrahydrobiopterin dehydratase [Chitinophagales bacterium]|nr:4a-hydroxytetrahydrobiopterin dehydratase [Chitinophagales bacterium]HNO29830.1 4a-hydroxytetrahydrobiopterin dehydratase [Chitinophagales bacterium]